MTVDIQSDAPTHSVLCGHSETVNSAAWSPDGCLLASASADTSVRVWSAAAGGEALHVLKGHTGYVYSVAWSADGALVASASGDQTVRPHPQSPGRVPTICRPRAEDGVCCYEWICFEYEAH